jgi:pyruvate,water dikinase
MSLTPWLIDSLASDRYPVYSRANAGEVAPHPVSPLSATMVLGGPGELGYRDAYIAAGTFRPDEFEADRANCVAFFGGYMYLNMSLTRIYGVRMPGMTPEMVDAQYFGDMPGITPYDAEARPTDDDPEASAKLGGYLAELFATVDLPDLRADQAQIARLVDTRPHLEGLGDQELVDHARSFIPLFRRLFCRHILVSAGTGVGLGTASAICAAVGRPELSMALFSGLGDVDSAAPSWALWDLSRLAAGHASLRPVVIAHGTGREPIDEFAPALSELGHGGDEAAAMFLARWQQFLRRFASRGPNEWDLRADTWGTKPRLVLAALVPMINAPDTDSPQMRTDRRVAERSAALSTMRHLLEGADDMTRGTFEAAVRCGQVYAAGRERTKTHCIAVVHEMRLALDELARRHVETNALDHRDQLFLLTERELDDFVRVPGDFTDVLRRREVTYRELFDVEPPFVTHGMPAHWTTWPRRSVIDAEPLAAGAVLTGIAGCPGVARGRVRVITDPGDPRGLEPGDVLVAPLTDPAWTPLFVTASAVVVDVGAQITHAVIVSRELGLPCVVSVTGATTTLRDGAVVEVDGGAGTVTVIEP